MSRGVHHFWHRATRLIKSWTHTSTIDGNVKCEFIERGLKPFKIPFLKVVLHVAEAPHNHWGFISICLCFGWERGHGRESSETACEALGNPCHPKLGSRVMSSDWNWLRGKLSGTVTAKVAFSQESAARRS